MTEEPRGPVDTLPKDLPPASTNGSRPSQDDAGLPDQPAVHASARSEETEPLPAGMVMFATLFWVVLGLVITIVLSQTVRTWMGEHLLGVACAGVVVFVAFLVPAINGRLRMKGAPARAAAILLIGYPLILASLISMFFFMPNDWQLVALRSVAIGALVISPTLMWWLFLAAKRASLLNEFISNLHRLGLLARGHSESAEGKKTRISSYLQKFEGSYGTLPKDLPREVQSGHLAAYNSEAVNKQSLSTTVVPVYLTAIVLTIGWLVALPPVGSFPVDGTEPRWLLAFSPNVTPVTAAFMGAYFFSMQTIFRRYVGGDLRGSAYIAVALRIILAVIGIWIIVAATKDITWISQGQLIILGFAFGVFPVIIWQIIRGFASKHFRSALPTLESRLALDNLDGLTVWHQARLEEEDVENVFNMATVDIVDLLVNTRFPAGRIVDWIDQALLLTQLGADEAKARDAGSEAAQRPTMRQKLAGSGIRTASSLVQAAKGDPTLGSLLLDEADARRMTSVARAVTTSSNLQLVMSWRGLTTLLDSPAGAHGDKN